MNTKKIIGLVIIGVVTIAVVAGVIVYSIKPGKLGCAWETRICPDGSLVGRTGPYCTFAACPGQDSSNTWKTTKDAKTGASFQYPDSLHVGYINAVDWPPSVQFQNEPLVCNEAGSETDSAGRTEELTIEGRVYCVTQITEGAAGSVYTQYAYAFEKDGKTVIFTFSLQMMQCENYDEPRKSECNLEQAAFSADGLIDRITQSVMF